jgi:hypothetical protein
MKRNNVLLLLALAGAVTAGCGGKEATPPPAPVETPTKPAVVKVSFVSATIGSAIGADKKVTAATDSFGPNDTIYASIETDGSAPSAQLTVRWMYEGGQLVREESQSIAPTGPATSEFHVSKPDGWPKGAYSAEILLDGVQVYTAPFRVI